MKVRDIINTIEEFAPVSIQEGWDNSGLCVGSPEDEVTSILFALDCTPELVDEAIECGADMIITHHPLIFSGLKKISSDNLVGAAVIKAIRAGISIYAAHTNADKVLAGVSGAMAKRLGLENVSVLADEGNGIGLGVVGDLPQPLSAVQAIQMVKERFGLKMVKSSKPLDGPVTKIAMCGGSGGSLIGAAQRAGAQLYISGDISYHNFFTQNDFMIMDIGHYESEIDVVNILFSLINKKFPNFAVRITQNINSNPIYYF